MKRLLFSFVMILMSSVLLLGKPGDLKILKRGKTVFENTDCQKNNSCDLKRVEYLEEDYSVELYNGTKSYNTRLFAKYTTETVADLEKYVFVQFIRGCIYYSRITDGRLNPDLGRNKHYSFGEEVYFNFPQWVIDSLDSDPAYNSTDLGRHYDYRWSVDPFFNRETEKYYGIDKPTTPSLYVTDLGPRSAFWETTGSAQNLLIDAKLCIYKESDVPQKTVRTDINFAEPIHCYYWYGSWVFNHSTETFEHPNDISACSKLPS